MAETTLVGRMGFASGQAVAEVGYDEDCDQGLREVVEKVTGNVLVGEDFDGMVDAVLLWHREGDGELADSLEDAKSVVASGGTVWLFTPKAGRDGHVDLGDIEEGLTTAGLSRTESTSVLPDWNGTRITVPGNSR
ncbi:DUF3052 domain-containing protein [Streptomyces sp. NPDC058369]|uniref:DUF3052 domain-containing protein n=1 Tax=unclassified Streptomyces TaxID=2593676 RepID=UPI002250558D|nr:DUF3052 domain-containing protein [Streptomyces sp. NBC_01789]MCX4451282.1 DUF3052 domain-containing protein [Streptomyces sp. NBC_01789]